VSYAFTVGKTPEGWWVFNHRTKIFEQRDVSESAMVRWIVKRAHESAMTTMERQIESIDRTGTATPGSYGPGWNDLTINVDAARKAMADQRLAEQPRNEEYVAWLERHAHRPPTLGDVFTKTSVPVARDFPMGA
jgi:hypothetical protein